MREMYKIDIWSWILVFYYWGDLLRSVPWQIFGKISIFSLVDVYSYVFDLPLYCILRKNTFPSSKRFVLYSTFIFACVMSGHDNWNFPKIIWKGDVWKVKWPLSIRMFITEHKQIKYLIIRQHLVGLQRFLWFVPFFKNLRYHGWTP